MADPNQDQLSNEDLAALHETYTHLAQANDPRAEKVRQFIAAQGTSMLHPTDTRGALEKGWDWLNKGFISKDTFVRALSGRTPEELKAETEPSQWDTPADAAKKAWIRGATTSTAEVGSSLTSPLSAATAAAGGAGAIPKAAEAIGATGKALAAARATGTAAKVISGVASAGFGAQGAKQLVENAPKAITGDPDAAQAALMGGAMAAGGAAGVGETVAPKVMHAPIAEAPTAALEAAQSGGAAIAEAGKTVGSKLLPSLVDGPPHEMMTRAVKPGKNNIRWKSDIQSAMPNMKLAEQDLGRPVQNIDDAVDAATLAKKKLWNQYEQRLGPYKNNATIDGNQIADAMMNSIDQRTATQHPELVERVKRLADTYRRDLTLSEAEDFLQSSNTDLSTYYAKNKVGRRVAQSDPETAATVAESDALRKSLYDRLDALTGPGAKDLKAQYGALTNVQNELIGRQNVAARQQPTSLAEQLSTARGYGKIAKGVLTLSPGDIAEGAESVGVSKFLKERQSSDAMIQRAFAATPTPSPTVIRPMIPRPLGLLNRGPIPMPSSIEPITPPGAPAIKIEPTTRAQRLGLLLPEKAGGRIVTPPPADTSGSIPYTPPPVAPDTTAARMGRLLPERAGGPQVPPVPGALDFTPPQRELAPLPKSDSIDYIRRANGNEQLAEKVANQDGFTLAKLTNAERLMARSGFERNPETGRVTRVAARPSSAPSPAAQAATVQPEAGEASVTSPVNRVDNAPPESKISESGASHETPESSRAPEVKAVPQSSGAGQEKSGAATTVRVPGEQHEYPATYQVRELDDIRASHSGVTFKANPKYALENDRDYSNAANQGKVILNSTAGKFDPSYHITDNPDATNGPIVIDSEGHALGGNGRAMILDRTYRFNQKGAQAYKDLLVKKAAQFGIDHAQIEGMKKPVLVRSISDEDLVNPEAKQQAITDFNKKGTAELTPSERAITDSRRVSERTMDDIAARFDAAGKDAKLSDLLGSSRAHEVIDSLINDGVITQQERAAYVGKAGLTDAAKDRISNLLVGRFFRDAAQLDTVPLSVRNKLERLSPSVSRTNVSPEWNLEPKIKEAMDILEEVKSRNAQTVDDVLKQNGLFDAGQKYSPEAIALAKRLKADSSASLAESVKKYAQDAQDSTRSLLGSPVTEKQAFDEAFAPKKGGTLGDKPSMMKGPSGDNPERGSFSMKPKDEGVGDKSTQPKQETPAGAATDLKSAKTGEPVTVELWHGTPDGRFLPEFDPNKKGYYKNLPEALADNTDWNKLHGGTGLGFKTRNEGISFSDDQSVAKSYSEKPAFDYQNSVPMVVKRKVNLQNPLVLDVGNKEWNLPMNETIRQAKEAGHDGIIFRNIKDNYHPNTTKKASNNVVVFDPRSISSSSDATAPPSTALDQLRAKSGYELDPETKRLVKKKKK